MRKLIIILASLGFMAFANAQKNEAKSNKSERVVKVEIDEEGFKPEKIQVKKGEKLVLMVTRTTDKTCMKELKKPSGSNQVELPLNKEVRFEVGQFDKTGEVKLLCGMDMTAGVVDVL